MENHNEITLKEILELLRKYSSYIVTKWKTLLFVSVIFACVFGVWASLQPTKYTAKLSFMVNEDDSAGGVNMMSSILGQFGFGLSNDGRYNKLKILELAKSRKIATLVLFEKIKIEDQTDFIANHIIRKYGLINKWLKKDPSLHNFEFLHANVDSFTRMENMVLLRLYQKLKGEKEKGVTGLVTGEIDEDTGILMFIGSGIDEELTLSITNLFYEKLSQYYIEKTIGKQKATYKVFKTKVDSLEDKLKTINYSILKFEDSNRNLALKQYQAKKYQLQAELKKITESYSEAYKSLQIAELSLENRTPFITTIDKPIAPLQIEKITIYRALIFGLIIGMISSIVYFLLRKLVSDLDMQ